ncbi:hypothetical protein DIPPA_27862 [Diplonema papillatum]|nr:hypothetical protein DIPPA_27862 [Diplonema papillatum]KAJ9446117.1 hypothetical protein DIPPA_27862 [Diplonema papillatum]
MSRPITRIIRFLSKDGKVYLGEQPPPGARAATVLEGNVFETLARTDKTAVIDRLLSPIVPTEIFCIGLNYLKHFEESAKLRGHTLPEKPAIFCKSRASLNHPESPVWIPRLPRGDELDYEVELAFVIGKTCRNVSKETALSYVHGYTVGNDVSSRHWQKNAGAGQWNKGKSFDTFTPLGPVLVTTDEIMDPQKLVLRSIVNGEVRQNSNTSDMIFSVAQIIEWLSTEQTLLPGTVVLTGTPEGVAAGMKQPKWLKSGDIVECDIESIGILRNFICDAPADLLTSKM